MDMVVSEPEAGVTCIRLNGRLDAPGADRIDLSFTALPQRARATPWSTWRA